MRVNIYGKDFGWILPHCAVYDISMQMIVVLLRVCVCVSFCDPEIPSRCGVIYTVDLFFFLSRKKWQVAGCSF